MFGCKPRVQMEAHILNVYVFESYNQAIRTARPMFSQRTSPLPSHIASSQEPKESAPYLPCEPEWEHRLWPCRVEATLDS